MCSFLFVLCVAVCSVSSVASGTRPLASASSRLLRSRRLASLAAARSARHEGSGQIPPPTLKTRKKMTRHCATTECWLTCCLISSCLWLTVCLSQSVFTHRSRLSGLLLHLCSYDVFTYVINHIYIYITIMLVIMSARVR